MNNEQWSKYKKALTVLSVLVGLVAIPSARSIFKIADLGYRTNMDHAVIQVAPDGPAEKAGLQVGDAIKSIDGIDVKDIKSHLQRPKPKIDDIRAMTVEREGNQKEISLNLTEYPLQYKVHFLLLKVIGLCGIFVYLYVYLKVQSRITFLCLIGGLCMALGHFFQILGIESRALFVVYYIVFSAMLFLGLSLGAYFFLLFPKPKSLLEKKNVKVFLFAPAIACTVFTSMILLLKPAIMGVRNNSLILILNGGAAYYILWIGITVVHTYIRATPQERSQQGLNILFFGTVLVTALVLAPTIAVMVATIEALPGWMFYTLSPIIMPFILATAVLKTEKLRLEDSSNVNE